VAIRTGSEGPGKRGWVGQKHAVLWEEVPDCDPAEPIDRSPGSIESLLALSEEQRAKDAPWPPHYAKQEGEAPRVAPSRRRRS
jgi:hypothetical protein